MLPKEPVPTGTHAADTQPVFEAQSGTAGEQESAQDRSNWQSVL